MIPYLGSLAGAILFQGPGPYGYVRPADRWTWSPAGIYKCSWMAAAPWQQNFNPFGLTRSNFGAVSGPGECIN